MFNNNTYFWYDRLWQQVNLAIFEVINMPGKRKTTKYGEEVIHEIHLAWYYEHEVWHTYYRKLYTGVCFDKKKDARQWLRNKANADRRNVK